MKYDINLLVELNEEFKNKPFMKSFPSYDHEYQFTMAENRLVYLSKLINLNGKKVLEIGCGGGYVSRKLATDYKCKVVAIDIYESNVWDELGSEKNLEYKVMDLSEKNPFQEQSFDLIVSYVAWEHMKHPFKVLKECTKLLKPDGKIYIYANQYRSGMASHLYRNIFFPFPHLLFPDEVIVDYCLKNGVTQEWIDAFFYVNKLTYNHYKEYFRILNLEIEHEKLVKKNLDKDFFNRFKEKLDLYPKFDLELDFFEVILSKNSDKKKKTEKQLEVQSTEIEAKDKEIKQLLGKISQLETKLKETKAQVIRFKTPLERLRRGKKYRILSEISGLRKNPTSILGLPINIIKIILEKKQAISSNDKKG